MLGKFWEEVCKICGFYWSKDGLKVNMISLIFMFIEVSVFFSSDVRNLVVFILNIKYRKFCRVVKFICRKVGICGWRIKYGKKLINGIEFLS